MSTSLATNGFICNSVHIVGRDTITAQLLNDCYTNINENACGCPLSFKSGNTLNLRILVVAGDINISYFELFNATEITFVLKSSPFIDDNLSSVIKKKSLSQIEVLETVPNVILPNLVIPLSSSDMTLDSGIYYIGLCIEFNNGSKYQPELIYNGCKFNSVDIIQQVMQC